MNKMIRLMMSACTVFVGALNAQTPGTNSEFGFQLSSSLPENSLADWLAKKYGFGLGIHTRFDLGNGHALSPRLDYTTYSSSRSGPIHLTPVTNTWYADTIALSIDYNYFINHTVKNTVYILAGIGVISVHLHGPFNGDPNRMTGISLHGGVGYSMTRNLGMEVRYTHAPIDNQTKWDTYSNDNYTTYRGFKADSVQFSLFINL